MSEVTHAECGGTVMFERRRLPGDEQASTVLVCRRCSALITETNELHPQGAICGVVLRRSAA